MSEEKKKVKRAFFTEHDQLIIICPHCNRRNDVEDIPGDDFDKYKCNRCDKYYYAKSELRIVVSGTGE